jgi:uncharacterized membrane protein SirB2
MISYETYKVLHLFTLFMLLSAFGVVISEGRWIAGRRFKIIVSIVSFLVFVAGMGLIARLGFKHTEAFPLWIWVKMFCWGSLNIVLFGLFRIKSKQGKLILGSMAGLIIFVAVVTAVTKLM